MSLPCILCISNFHLKLSVLLSLDDYFSNWFFFFRKYFSKKILALAIAHKTFRFGRNFEWPVEKSGDPFHPLWENYGIFRNTQVSKKNFLRKLKEILENLKIFSTKFWKNRISISNTDFDCLTSHNNERNQNYFSKKSNENFTHPFLLKKLPEICLLLSI